MNNSFFKKIASATNRHKNALQLVGFFICFFSLFIFCYNIRQQLVSTFSQRTFLWGINYLAYIGFFLIFIATKRNYDKSDIIFRSFPLISLIFPLPMYLSGFRTFGFYIMYCLCCVFSLYFIMLEFSPEIRPIILRYFIISFNILILILVAWACIDNIFGQPILKWLSNYMTYNGNFEYFAYPTDTENDRFFSFFGHPLRNATLFNAYYIINILYNEHHKPIMPSWLCCILTFLALACCGSKTGLFVVVAITIVSFYKSKKLLIPIGILFIAIACSGLMNNLIIRLISTPLTTGRFSALKMLFEDTEHPLRFLSGYHSVDFATCPFAAFEFPAIMFSFEHGILFSILILGTILSYVFYKLYKIKHIKAFILWLLLYGEVNTYPDMAQDLDGSLIFCFLTMIILNICYDNTSILKRD